MFIFWSVIAVVFLILELLTFTFGFIFITIGSAIIALLLNLHILADTDTIYQFLLFFASAVIGFIFFYRSFKKSSSSKTKVYIEDTTAEIAIAPIYKDKLGKIKWCGTIMNALIDPELTVTEIPQGTVVKIKEFKGNMAIITLIDQ